MKSKLTRDQIEKLNELSADNKTELLTLFSDVEEAEAEVIRLRKAQPNDSQLVVEKTKFDELERAVAERDTKISTLEAKLQEFAIDLDFSEFGAFAPIFEIFIRRK